MLADAQAGGAIPADVVWKVSVMLAPSNPAALGGVVRAEQIADLAATAAPLYAKFGLRNSQPLYPSGMHLEPAAIAIAREKVHRARVALEWLERSGAALVQSRPGAAGLGVPKP